MAKHVAVLMGGWSAEREISLRSGKACAEALVRRGYRVTSLDVTPDIANALFSACGVPVAEDRVVSRFEAAKGHVLPPPYVVKPIAEGSSVGVFIVTQEHLHPPQELYRDDWPFGDMVMVERYVPGKELQSGVARRLTARISRASKPTSKTTALTAFSLSLRAAAPAVGPRDWRVSPPAWASADRSCCSQPRL